MLYQTANPHGGDIYTDDIRLDFSASVNPLGTPPSVTEALKAAISLAAKYPDPSCREAVSAISEHEGVPPEMILLGNGAAELIYAFCTAAAPRKALIAVPTFSEYEAALENTGCEVIHHQLLPEKDFTLEADFLDAIRMTRPDTVFLCDPNNPTGRLIDPDLLSAIIRLCAELDIRLFLDECFLDLTGRRSDDPSRTAGYPGLFRLKAFTKSYGLAGVRVGYCLSADSGLLSRMARAVQPWNVSVFAQAAAAAALKETDFLQKSVRIIKAEREYLTGELRNLGLFVCPSDVNYLLFRAPEGLDVRLRGEGIAIRSCANFPGLGPGWYRTAVRLHDENEILISRIRRILEGGA